MPDKLKRLLLPWLLAFLLIGCGKEDPMPPGGGDDTPVPGEYLLPVIETTDIHGHIVYNQNSTIHYRLAYIADKVTDIRAQGGEYRKDRLLLLDGGDIYQGASVSNLLAGKPVYVAMDRMEYDAVALGNHEFDWGFETLVDPDATLLDYEWEGTSEVNEVPVLCANLYRNGSRVTTTRDYVIVEKTAINSKGGEVKVRIGVIGFAIDYASSIMTSKFTGQGYSIREDYSIANDIAAELESSGKCDATVLLIHGAADRAAENLGQGSAVDLVLGGHSHSTLSGRTGSGISYLQAGRYCEHYASANLRFIVGQDGSVTYKSADNLKVSNVDTIRDRQTYSGQNAEDLDEAVLDVSNEALSAISEQSSEVIGYITVDASTYEIEGSGGRASVMANWMCDILRRIGDADVSFVNGGGIRTYISLEKQSQRDITVADVYEIFPFNNTTYVYEITYAELLEVFEYAMTSSGESLFTSMTGIDCRYRGNAVRSLAKDGRTIYRNGQWTDDWASRKAVLAVSEYLATNQRVDHSTGAKNPLLEWNGTSRLLSKELIDNENAIRVLRAEAARSDGHLYIDTEPHFIQD